MSEPFSVTIEDRIASDSTSARCKDFMRARGDRFLADVLISAGYTTGKWRFCLTEAIRSSGNHTRFQVKRPEHHGVILVVKPGDNSTAVQGILYPPKQYEPVAVYRSLITEVSQSMTEPENEKIKQTEEPEIIGVRAGEEIPSADQTLLTENQSKNLMKVLDSKQSVSVAKSPSIAEAVLANQEKLERLARLPKMLADVRRRRKQIADQIKEFQAQDEKLAQEEARIAGLDLEALAMLLDSMK